MTFTELLPIINSSIIAIGGLTVVVIYIYSNKNNVSSTVISNYKTLDEQKTQQISELQKAIEEIKANMRATEKGFIERIAKLEGQLKEKNNQIEALNQILANRNPELEKVLAEIRDFMKDIKNQNEHQTSILEESQKRNEVIDQSTDQEKGKVLRKS
jgi:uncharacterized coiled-coil protein SlyX